MKKLVTAEKIKNLVGTILKIDRKTIITPLAIDLIKEKGIKIEYDEIEKLNNKEIEIINLSSENISKQFDSKIINCKIFEVAFWEFIFKIQNGKKGIIISDNINFDLVILNKIPGIYLLEFKSDIFEDKLINNVFIISSHIWSLENFNTIEQIFNQSKIDEESQKLLKQIEKNLYK